MLLLMLSNECGEAPGISLAEWCSSSRTPTASGMQAILQENGHDVLVDDDGTCFAATPCANCASLSASSACLASNSRMALHQKKHCNLCHLNA